MPKTTDKQIADRIRARRKRLHLRQWQVAQELSTSTSNYSRIECGENTISAVDLAKLADVLNCSVGYLVGEEELLYTEDERELLRLYRSSPAAFRPAAKAMLEAAWQGGSRD